MSDASQTPGAYRTYGGTVLHLYLPGYQPGRKTRPLPSALCGAAAWGTSRGPLVWYPAPPVVPPEPLRWCPKCVGCALDHAGLLSAALSAVAAYFIVPVDTSR